jgi:hypothetical protein
MEEREVANPASLLDSEKSDSPFPLGIFADFEGYFRTEDDQDDRAAQDNEGAQQQQCRGPRPERLNQRDERCRHPRRLLCSGPLFVCPGRSGLIGWPHSIKKMEYDPFGAAIRLLQEEAVVGF